MNIFQKQGNLTLEDITSSLRAYELHLKRQEVEKSSGHSNFPHIANVAQSSYNIDKGGNKGCKVLK